MRYLLIFAALAGSAAQAQPAEEPVDPYVMSDANAGATPYEGERLFAAFNGREGVARIVDRLIDDCVADPRIGEVFKGHDMARLRRTLKEQFCYLLGGGCAYTGRDMTASHKDLGVQTADFNALVENLQTAMDAEGVPFTAQNRLLAKLAPMKRVVVGR